MGKQFHMNERQFLNLPTNMRAYIIAYVEDSSQYPACCDQYREGGLIKLTIADCHADIELDFDLSSGSRRNNAVHKAKTLADILTRFHAAIEAEVKAIEERETLKLHARAAASIH